MWRWHRGLWFICNECNGDGYINNKECLLCKYKVGDGEDSPILRGKIWIVDNFEDPVSPPSSPR